MKYFVLMCSFILLTISCDDPMIDPPLEEPEVMENPNCTAMDEKSLELVTGIRFFDDNGNPVGKVGNPNVTSQSPIRVYPNPNNGVIAISNQNNIEYELLYFLALKILYVQK